MEVIMLINEIIILLLIGYDYTSWKKEEVNILTAPKLLQNDKIYKYPAKELNELLRKQKAFKVI